MTKTYYLVIYEENKPKNCATALPSILDEETAKILLQQGNPTIERKRENKKFQVLNKRFFEYENTDGSKTLFIICDGKLILPNP